MIGCARRSTALYQEDGNIDEYFQERTKLDLDTGCWLWQWATDRDGYGIVGTNWVFRKYHKSKAHQVAYLVYNGSIPDGLVVRHKCRHANCCNPDHLELGTRTDNNLDKKRDGTESRGEDHGTSKLTEADVLEIRTMYDTGQYSQSFFVKKYGLNKTTIRNIVRRLSWTHI